MNVNNFHARGNLKTDLYLLQTRNKGTMVELPIKKKTREEKTNNGQ